MLDELFEADRHGIVLKSPQARSTNLINDDYTSPVQGAKAYTNAVKKAGNDSQRLGWSV